jgi:citrate synthase
MSWLTTEEALTELRTKPQTLYANVSRGRIRAKPDPADPRRSLYSGEDVTRLAERHAGRRRAETVAAQTIRWGDPILTSSISTIADGRLYYRGKDAVELAAGASLEDVAQLLWASPRVVPTAARAAPAAEGSPLEAAFRALGHLAAVDLPMQGRAPAALHREAAAVLGTLADALTGGQPADGPLHLRLARAWARPEAADLVRRALVLLADHELNASTFAARVAASTGASVSASVLAGLATLTGPLHGSAALGARALVDLASGIGAEAAVRQYLAQGRPLPAFGHQLYPNGDCRAAALLGGFGLPAPFAQLRDTAERITGNPANVDFALAALTAAFGLPAEAPLTLFALARSTGWIAHALEQHATGSLIRPRAHYVGPPVGGR